MMGPATYPILEGPGGERKREGEGGGGGESEEREGEGGGQLYLRERERCIANCSHESCLTKIVVGKQGTS
jgi:hypothetical protein